MCLIFGNYFIPESALVLIALHFSEGSEASNKVILSPF